MEVKDIKSFNVLAFDKDDTITESRKPIDQQMALILDKLLLTKKIAIISGGDFLEFENKILNFLDKSNFSNLIIFPASGSSMFVYKDNAWQIEYQKIITKDEATHIGNLLLNKAKELNIVDADISFDDTIDHRVSQITFSIFNENSSLTEKANWDPDQQKRKQIISLVKEEVGEEYDILIGGKSSIDIVLKGYDKAFGLYELVKYLGVKKDDVLFFGDKMEIGGNDYSVKEAGFNHIVVKDVRDTKQILESILS